MKHPAVGTVILTSIICGAGAAPAAKAGETFGPAGAGSTYIPAMAFSNSEVGNCSMVTRSIYFAQSTGCGPVQYFAPLEVPEGALITDYRPSFYDNDPDDGLVFTIAREYASAFGGPPSTSGYDLVPSSTYSSTGASADVQSPFVPIGAGGNGHVYDTYDHTQGRHHGYLVAVQMPAATEVNVQLRGIWIFYRRQAAPPPAAASFNDVPSSHPFFNEVEQLAKSGITQGCGGNNFCPDAAVTRGQMAAFLSRALGLHWDFGTNAP